LDDSIAKHGSSCGMPILTSLGLELRGELLRRDLNNASLLVWATIAVVTVVDHLEKAIEFKIIIEHAKINSIINDRILIIRILIMSRGDSIIIIK